MDEDSDKPMSMAPKKNRTNDRKSFCILYLSLMASATIAIAVQAMDENKDSLTAVVHDMLLGAQYATSACVMLGATVYFALKRGETFEAAQRISGPVSFIVKYSRNGEPVNLYLRLGLALFAAMSIGQSAIRLHEMQSQDSMHWPEVFKTVFEISFFAAQTLLILIYHRIVILHNNEIFGACFIHVLSTNFCMWADVMVDKVSTTLHLDQDKDVHTGSSVSFYLLPAVSEYCLLSAALIFEITFRIGQPSYIELKESEHGSDIDDETTEADDDEVADGNEQTKAEDERQKESTDTQAEREAGEGSSKSPTISDPELGARKSKKRRRAPGRSLSRVLTKHIKKVKALATHCGMNIKSGYWAPLLIVLTISALTVTTGVTPKAPNDKISPWKCAVLFAEEMFLNCMGIFVALASFFKLRHLKFTIASRQSTIDEFVLYIAFFFSANYLVATIALASYFNRVAENVIHKDLLMGRLALNLLELVEVILQTYLIQDCFRRCSEEDFQQRIKPGRQMIAVLLGINLAGWIVKSFQLKEADILNNITLRDDIAYGWVLIAITMPVFLFYRYHCTVCLSQAFTMLYEDETRRFEALWRQNPIYLSNLLSHTNLTACEDGGDHFHARENLTSVRISSRQLSEMLHRKFSTQSFQQIEYMIPRRASFFHPAAALSTSTNSMHDAELILGAHHHPSQPNAVNLVHKLSAIQFSQKKLSVPNLKRLSISGPKPSFRAAGTNAGAIPSRCRLAQSESYEGPNYFLSRISPVTSNVTPAIRNEHSTQTTAPYENLTSSTGTTYPHTPRPGTLQIPGSPLKANHNQPGDGGTPLEADGMQRRQTLVNLETAKYRYLAAEMAHKRVLERSVDAAGESGKKRGKSRKKQLQQHRDNKDGKSAKGKNKRNRQKSDRSSPDNVPSSPTIVTCNAPKIVEPPQVQTSQTIPLQPQQSQVSVRGFEPSKVVPLLIARNVVNTTDGEPLSAVPEEAGHDSLTPSPPLVLTSPPSSPPNERVLSVMGEMKDVKLANTFQVKQDNEINESKSHNSAISPSLPAIGDTTELESASSSTDSSTPLEKTELKDEK